VLLEYKGEDIVIGTHGTILAAILNYYDKKYDYAFSKAMKMPDVFRFVFNQDKIYSIENILL
jgi:2,3-bisphosphoglycerate-dependent phosphoglycerate mutase